MSTAERVFSPGRVVPWHIVSWPVSPITAQITSRELRHLPEGSKVLDVGVGTGRTAAVLSRRFKVDGVDASHAMLDAARKRLPESVRLFYAPASALPFPAGSYDAVVYNHVLRYLDIQDVDSALSEAGRVLRRGGVLVVSDLNMPQLRPGKQQVQDSLDARILGLWALFSKGEFIAHMQQAGFEHKRTLYPPLSFMLLFKKK